MRPLTRSCFLLPLLGRFSLPSPCPCNLPSFTVEFTLSSLSSHSDPPLFCQGAALAHLTIWCSGQTALFLFLLGKAAPAFLPTALSVARRPLFPFQQAQYAKVSLLKRPPFCTLFAGLDSINKSAASLLLSDSRSVPPPCSLLHLSFCLILSGSNSLFSPSVSSRYNGSLDTRFFRGTTRLMN